MEIKKVDEIWGAELTKTLILVHILLLACILSCKTEKSDSIVQQEYAFLDLLKLTDSIDCWGIQFIEYIDTSTLKAQLAEAATCNVHYATNDSIFSFTYPCENYRNERYLIQGRNLIMPGSQNYRINISGDTLWLQGKSMGDHYYDSLEVITLESYVKMRISTSELLNSFEITADTTCWRSVKSFDCIQNWHHYEDIRYGFQKEYKKF